MQLTKSNQVFRIEIKQVAKIKSGNKNVFKTLKSKSFSVYDTNMEDLEQLLINAINSQDNETTETEVRNQKGE